MSSADNEPKIHFNILKASSFSSIYFLSHTIFLLVMQKKKTQFSVIANSTVMFISSDDKKIKAE